ncbi:MAG: extracellular solute-binding protein [Thermotogota bacterium]|nr:extracellular solute-binding protein [Thermotogota bacterium]
MRKLSRVFLLLVSLMFLGSVLFGTVEVWVSWEGESLFRELSQEWETETGEQVKLIYIPELEEKLTITLKGGGDLPDICLIKTDNLPLILDYAQPIETTELDGLNYVFDEKLVQAFQYRSKNYVIPYYADMQLMYLSEKIFDQLGINLPDNDWTFDEFIEIMKAIDEMDIQPSGWGINSAYIFTGLQEGLGSPVMNDDGNVNLLTQENISLLQQFRDWYHAGLLFDYVTRPNIVKAFFKGELAMFPQGSFLIQKFLSSKLDFAIRSLPAPWRSVIDPKGFICFNNHPHTVSLLKKYLEANEDFAKDFIKYPAIKPKQPKEILYYSQMERAVKNGMVQPIDDQYIFGYWPAMRTALDLILKEGVDVQGSLKKAQEYIDQK